MTDAIVVGDLSDDAQISKHITWMIPGLRVLPEEAGSSVDSPCFFFYNDTWRLRLYPNGVAEDMGPRWITVSLVRTQKTIHWMIKVNLTIQQRNDKKFRYPADENFQWLRLDPYVFRIVKRSRLESHDGRLCCPITVFCTMSVSEKFRTKESFRQAKRLKVLMKDFSNLLHSERNCDVTVNVRDRSFRLHQCILRTRSQVFDSMLKSDMAEKNSGVVNITDCDPSAFEQFLFYIYGGHVKRLDQTNMLDLYYIADKYNVADLRQECREFIKKSLSCRVVCNVMDLALKHNDTDILPRATDYFAENVTEILKTVEWQSFMKENSTRANELLIQASTKWNSSKK